MIDILPADPPGWALPLTDDGQWEARDLASDTTIGPFGSKIEAVAAISERTNRADLLPAPPANDL